MSAEVTSPHAIDDETLAAFADGRLDDNERAVVRAHLDGCAECRDTLNLIAGAQDEDIIPRQATVIRGGRFRRYAPWMAAAAAAAAVIVSLPDVQERVAYYRTGGISKLESAAATLEVRHQKARLSGEFPHRRFKGPKRSAGSDRGDTEYLLDSAILDIKQRVAEGTPSVRELRALAVAQLFAGEYDEAVATMETVVRRTANPDADLLSDLAAMYLERALWRGDDDGHYGAAALQYAQRAWALEQKPETAWNLALAFEQMQGNAEAADKASDAARFAADAKRMWEEYLKLDPSSPWAAEARDASFTHGDE